MASEKALKQLMIVNLKYGYKTMYIINIDNRYVLKTKSLDLNCYSVNSEVWKSLDELFLKSLWLNTEDLALKNK